MFNGDWKARLSKGIKANKKSQRAVSIAAGLGTGYVNSLLKEGKDPSLENLIKVCEAAGLSLNYVLLGLDMDPETEEIIQLASSSTPEKRKALLELLRGESRP